MYKAKQMYKLRDFRAKTREAFDKAETGDEVLIERGGTVFVLMLADGLQRSKLNLADSKQLAPAPGSLCTHFASRGFCKFKKCPHSMFNPKNRGA